jgi:predicted permease
MYLPFKIVGRPQGNRSITGVGDATNTATVSWNFFHLLRILLLRGRMFTEEDTGTAPRVALINEAMAKKYWPQGDPLKDLLEVGTVDIMGPAYASPPRQMIGIVGDTHAFQLDSELDPMVYTPIAQIPDGVTASNSRTERMYWMVRTKVEPNSLADATAMALRVASGGLPVGHIRTMGEIVVRSTSRQRFNMLLLTIFGASALLMAAIGIYGVMAYSVQQRTQEIGIRIALGAASNTVRNMVIRQGMGVALLGVAIGLTAAYGLTRVIATFLFGVTARDPVVFVSVPLLLSGVALLGVWLPARRAARVDPVVALRME